MGGYIHEKIRLSRWKIITPNENDMEYINQKISSELEMGIVKGETLKGFQRIIKQLKKENNIEAVILGCTELPLLLSDKVSPVPCLDTMQHYPAPFDEQRTKEWIVWNLEN